jgi:hypothetical protein
MSVQSEEHPLTKSKHVAAFTFAGLFCGLESPIGPATPLGTMLSFLCIAGIIWLYWRDLTRMRHTPVNNWPWISLILICVVLLVPGYLLYAKADEQKTAAGGVVNDAQRGGQSAGTINNNGPVYNVPVQPEMSERLPKCPLDARGVWSGNQAIGNGGDGFHFKGGGPDCFIGNTANGNGGRGFDNEAPPKR